MCITVPVTGQEPVTALALLAAAGLTAAQIRQAAARGGLWLAGRRTRDPLALVTPGVNVAVHFPPGDQPVDIQLTSADILYDDGMLLAVHKRSGWYVGATPWDDEGHVLAAAQRWLARHGRAPDARLAHQLDRDTSGVLLLSLDRRLDAALQAAFASGAVQKRYLALCAGRLPQPQLELHTGHGRGAHGQFRVYPPDTIGQRLPGGTRVKLARTRLRECWAGADISLVEALPGTGRTHQIRLHLAHAGCPILGDARYGGLERYGDLAFPGHLLHAEDLELDHPLTGVPVQLHAPRPAVFGWIQQYAGVR